MQRVERFFLSLAGLAGVLTLWQVFAWTGLYPRYLFPWPGDVLQSLSQQLHQGVLGEHIAVSLFRFFSGYLVAAVVAIPLGLLLGWSRRLWIAVDPLVQVLRPISPIAWLPLVTLWFGIGDLPAIVIIFMASFYPILLGTIAAVKNVDPVYIKVAKNFGASGSHILWRVIVPAAFPYITMGLHFALGTAWIFLVAGEMMGVRSGLGFLIIDARNSMDTGLVIAGMLVIGLLGLAIDRLFGWLERLACRRWGIMEEEGSRWPR
ncbi:ABC transporter permease [Neomoorella thermoacetica]|uniref:ABC transporter permease n=1 Tax=Neomoorella thermoacetica TaxID=1525 RepID=UPI0008FB46F9|nr:ABC transporter permease [Moorella thermoacetica]APC09213.1 bicarbonate transport system permease protein CmpB [Moorella thermoacetica]